MKNFEQRYTLIDNRELILRSPRLGDEEGLINQIKQVDKETKFLAREEGEFSFTMEQEYDFINHCLEDDKRFFIIAEVGDEIVGTCAASLVSSGKRFMHRASLGIAISKKYWKLGIGNKMMETCINWCKENDIEQLELDVVKGNSKAKMMYEKWGFEVSGIKRHAMKYSDGAYADEYNMVLFFDK